MLELQKGYFALTKTSNSNQNLKKTAAPTPSVEVKTNSDILACPKCQKGTVLKGKTAYGCSNYKESCDFKVTFDTVRAKLQDQKPTKDLVYKILKNSH